MKKLVSILLIASLTIMPVTSNANGFTDLVRTIFKNKVESKTRVNQALHENDVFREALKTIELVNEKANYMSDKQVRTLKNSIDDRTGNFGREFKTKKGQLNSLTARLKNKKITIDDHKDFQEWLQDIPTNDVAKFEPLEVYKDKFSNTSTVNVMPSTTTIIPSIPMPMVVPVF